MPLYIALHCAVFEAISIHYAKTLLYMRIHVYKYHVPIEHIIVVYLNMVPYTHAYDKVFA